MLPVSRAPRRLALVLAAVVGLFLLTIPSRAPWRGHLAKGDQWVTALALRWVRAWHRDGAWHERLALIESPPTVEFAGERKVVKWGMPGHPLFLHTVLSSLGVEPDVERVMRVNLGLHLLLALLLAALALALARRTWPDRPGLATLVGLHAGAFTVLFPPLLYWGQNVSLQDFTVLPLLVFVAAARRLREGVASPRARRALDAGVGACVFAGTVTDFIFWVFVPYLVVSRLLAARRGRPHTTDPWLVTLALPFALAMGCLLLVFHAQGQLGLLEWRARTWTLGGSDRAAWRFVVVRLYLFFLALRRHFADAFGLLGFACLAVAFVRLARRRPIAGVPPEVRGVLLDLFVPCVLIGLALAPQQAFHSVSAIKFVPFVVLAWTLLLPAMVLIGAPRRRRLLAAGWAILAVPALLPSAATLQRFFPTPELGWSREGRVLREHTLPADIVVSPTTEIDLVPPQQIALAERRVTRVYDPLDLLGRVTGASGLATIAFVGPAELRGAFGGARATLVADGDLTVARYPVGEFLGFMHARRDAALRERLADVLRGGMRPADGDLRPQVGGVASPASPLAMHTIHPAIATFGGMDRLYWRDERRFHWRAFQFRARDRELLVDGDETFGTDWMGLWRPAGKTQGVADGPAEWGRFVLGTFQGVEALARAGAAWTYRWQGYDVVRVAVSTIPRLLRTWGPSVTAWDAHLVFRDAQPVAVALAPTAPAPAAQGTASWVVVLLDRPVAEVTTGSWVAPQWRVQQQDAAPPGVGP